MKLKLFFAVFIFVQIAVVGQENKACFLCKPKLHQNPDPYSIHLKKEWPVLLGSTSIALAGFFAKEFDNISPFTPLELHQLNRENINRWDKGATYNYSQSANSASDILLLSSLVVMPQFFLFNKHTNKKWGTLLVLTYEVAAINYGITNLFKSTVNRSRPYVYNTDLTYTERTDDDSRYSFYSGHVSMSASLSFLFAKTLTDFHPSMAKSYKIGVWSFAALLPATIGYLRIKAGQHYPTDVLAGYAMGALTGWLVPALHKQKKKNFSIFPARVFQRNGLGLRLQW